MDADQRQRMAASLVAVKRVGAAKQALMSLGMLVDDGQVPEGGLESKLQTAKRSKFMDTKQLSAPPARQAAAYPQLQFTVDDDGAQTVPCEGAVELDRLCVPACDLNRSDCARRVATKLVKAPDLRPLLVTILYHPVGPTLYSRWSHLSDGVVTSSQINLVR